MSRNRSDLFEKQYARVYYFEGGHKEFERSDMEVLIMSINPEFNDDLDKVPHPKIDNHPELDNIPYFYVEAKDIPHTSDSIHKYYTDDKKTVKLDNNWDFCLMKPNVLGQKHIKRLKEKIDNELTKKNTDMKQVMVWTREIENCKKWDKETWYKKALEALDEKVAKGEPDKPKIREKLNHRLNHPMWK